ncbi:bifunctional diguanylate cyclase/phosphodiesterase [Luedemannella helvata]|uniref:Diguanylate cyclase/phosphodiesterase n=1 Tax=Luedemannella helvata TaxID=349315 RepID=A0ABN2K7N7_9ACTN
MIREAVRRLRWQERSLAGTDPVTGLPDRRTFFGAVGRGDGLDGVLVLDLDLFREVVESLGHAAGDRLLAAVARRLRENLPSDDLITRLDGAAFAIMVSGDGTSRGRPSLERAGQVERLLAEPVLLDGLALEVSAAIGLAWYPEHGSDAQTLMRHADTAMAQARSGSGVAVYSPRADHHSAARLALLADLRAALGRRDDELCLHYQPQVELATGRVVGVEALLRWRHPRRGHIQPANLVALAERTAVMRQVTDRVLADAVAQAAAWRAAGLAPRMSVNVSARDLHHPGLVESIADLLRAHDLPAGQLQIEITESALMIDPPGAVTAVHRLDRLGVALSLDDFGTGYSSLRHLRRLPLSEVKMDRSFVLGMATDPRDAAVARAVVRLGGELGLRVVAEGVEDDRTRRMLVEAGCGLAQGWLFAAPMPAAALPEWLIRYDAARRPVAADGTGYDAK